MAKSLKFRKIRQSKELTLKDIFMRTGIRVSRLSDYERGRDMLTYQERAQLAEALDVRLIDIEPFNDSSFVSGIEYGLIREDAGTDKYGNPVLRYTAAYTLPDGERHYLGHFFIPVTIEKQIFQELFRKAMTTPQPQIYAKKREQPTTASDGGGE